MWKTMAEDPSRPNEDAFPMSWPMEEATVPRAPNLGHPRHHSRCVCEKCRDFSESDFRHLEKRLAILTPGLRRLSLEETQWDIQTAHYLHHSFEYARESADKRRPSVRSSPAVAERERWQYTGGPPSLEKGSYKPVFAVPKPSQVPRPPPIDPSKRPPTIERRRRAMKLQMDDHTVKTSTWISQVRAAAI